MKFFGIFSISFIICFVGGIEVQAAKLHRCLKNLTLKEKPFKTIHYKGTDFILQKVEDGVSARELKEILTQLLSVQDMMTRRDSMGKSFFSPPKVLHIDVKKQFDNAFFSPREQKLTITHQMVFEFPLEGGLGPGGFKKSKVKTRKVTKNPSITRAVDKHEIGHSYFFSNIALRDPRFKGVIDFIQNKRKWDASIYELKKDIDSIEGLAKLEAVEFEKRINIKRQKIEQYQSAISAMEKVEQFLNYDHFIQRWVSVLEHGHGDHIQSANQLKELLKRRVKALDRIFKVSLDVKLGKKTGELSQALGALGLKKNEAYALLGSVQEMNMADFFIYNRISGAYNELFADMVSTLSEDDPRAVRDALFHAGFNRATRNQMEARNYEIVNDMIGWPYEGIHRMLAPMGDYLWDSYFSRPLYRKHKTEVLSHFFTAVVKEVAGILFEGKALSKIQEELEAGFTKETFIYSVNESLRRTFEDEIKGLKTQMKNKNRPKK